MENAGTPLDLSDLGRQMRPTVVVEIMPTLHLPARQGKLTR